MYGLKVEIVQMFQIARIDQMVKVDQTELSNGWIGWLGGWGLD